MDKKKLHTRYTSVAITIAIVIMLILSGPVSAVTLSINELDGTSHTKGDSVTFKVTATIEDPDRYVPIDNFSLEITGDTNKEVIFSTDGTVLSGDSGITVSRITGPTSSEYGYGYGYGYDSNLGYGYNFGYGYGYGYGYGAGGGEVEYEYEITIDTSILNTGTHAATLSLNTGNSAKPSFSSSSATFTIKAASSKAASSGGSSSGGTGSATTRTSSGEDSQNIIATISQLQIVSAGREVYYDFSGENKEVSYIKFKGLSNLGMVRANIEYLNGISSLVGNDVPDGMIYRNFNIQIDSNTFDSSKMEDAVIGFKVPKKWLSENGIEPAWISLMHYDNGWERLDTTQTNEDGEYYYFEAKTSGFSPFAIVALTSEDLLDHTGEDREEDTADNEQVYSDQDEGVAIPSMTQLGLFVLIVLIGIVGAAYMMSKRKEDGK